MPTNPCEHTYYCRTGCVPHLSSCERELRSLGSNPFSAPKLFDTANLDIIGKLKAIPNARMRGWGHSQWLRGAE